MTKPIQSIHATRAPHKAAASFRAAVYMITSGPLTPLDLFAAVHFGNKRGNRMAVLERALATGWLIEVGNKVDVSQFARDHFKAVEEAAQAPTAPTGSIAARREYNAYEQPTLSRKYFPNPRGFRDDTPTWSQRGADHHFFTVA